MRRWIKSFPHLRLSLMLMVTFLVVGIGVGSVVLVMAGKREESRGLELAVSSAQLASSTVKLTRRPVQINLDLEAALAKIPGGSRLMLVKPRIKRGGRGEFVVFAYSDINGGKLSSKFLREPSPDIRRAVSDGATSAEYRITDDASSIIVYTPVFGASGKSEAVLIMEQSVAGDLRYWGGVGPMAILASLMLLLLATLGASILTRQIATTAGETPWAKGMNSITRSMRTVVGEILLATITIGVIGLAAYANWGEYQSSTKLRSIAKQLDRTTDLRQAALVARAGNQITTALKVINRAVSLGVLPTYTLRMNETTPAQVWQTLDRVANRSRDSIQILRVSGQAIQKASDDRRGILYTVNLCVILLTLGSVILVRISAAQQQELRDAQMDSIKHQGAYRQVAENLPIGLFSFHKGSLRYTNKVWDRVTNRFPFEERMEAFYRSLHPEDRDRVQAALDEGETKLQPFDIQYRLVDSQNQTRFMESRAVPVVDPDGNVEHMLGFALDITGLVQAKEELEVKNTEVVAKNSQLQKALSDIEDNFEAMVASLVKAVEAKDPYTAGHSERVMGYSVRIGREMNLSDHQLRVLERGTLIHDIGKIGVPDAILTKPSALTDEEYALIKQHPMIGFRMIQGIPMFNECIPIVLWHHERMDGKGYPDRLAGDQIPLLVRICTVSDCFDAMTSNRAYRKGMDPDRAISLLRQDAGGGILDGQIVEVLAQIVARDGLLWRDQAA